METLVNIYLYSALILLVLIVIVLIINFFKPICKQGYTDFTYNRNRYLSTKKESL